MKIAISSDNHLDSNHLDPDQVSWQQAAVLNQQEVDIYLFAGDLFNDFQRTLDYFRTLQARTRAKVLFIAGNHDMLQNISPPELETFTDPLYFHRQVLEIPHWYLAGNNGWYDYSFSKLKDNPDQIRRWKKAFWPDGMVQQEESDYQREDRVLAQVKRALDQVGDRKILLATHFVPQKALLWPRGPMVNTTRRKRMFEMVQAMLGSQRLGDLINTYPQVKYLVYGHVHGEHRPQRIGGTVYLNQAVGVKRPRNHEWQRDNFMDQWCYKLRILDLK